MLTELEIYRALTEIFRDVFMRDDITLSAARTAKERVGWVPFKQIEIIIAVESRYHIKFNTRELDSLLSVGDLVRVIANKA